MDPAEYCKELVRKHDYEGFLTSHFYPANVKGGYFALKAFAVELAMVQDHVSNQTIGKMRMQFWRDAVKGIHDGKPPRHPIALALHQASQHANLPAYHLKRIVDARDAELSTPTHMTTESLTAHAESTSSSLLYLLLSLLSLPSSALSHAASHLGTAQTFATLLRALPFHAKQGHVIIPAEITAKHGVKQEDVLRYGPEAERISDAVFEFATVANDHLITAREMLKEEGMGGKVPARAMPIFLTGIIFYDLDDPGPLTLVNKRFYHFSQDPYVRAHYFLTHYGPTEAVFHALGRGKILTEQVLDDPLMGQFPLALAIEPRLLPYAVNNGFFMDSKYRDFVFRKMFERTSNDAQEVVHNVRELCRLDPTMFVSRTVAAEVCMEAKTNVSGYGALKILDKSGNLRFELA
ncbi:hypothetical protein C0991_003312 [Blastosporella zonata]|nr:hypothetical protein C0991_003312 [Blastosporella zonata]